MVYYRNSTWWVFTNLLSINKQDLSSLSVSDKYTGVAFSVGVANQNNICLFDVKYDKYLFETLLIYVMGKDDEVMWLKSSKGSVFKSFYNWPWPFLKIRIPRDMYAINS